MGTLTKDDLLFKSDIDRINHDLDLSKIQNGG